MRGGRWKSRMSITEAWRCKVLLARFVVTKAEYNSGAQPMQFFRCGRHGAASCSEYGPSNIAFAKAMLATARGAVPKQISKQKLQSELNASRAVCRNESAEGRRADEVIRQPEVRMVEEIEELRAELDGRGLLYSGVLDQREVDVFVTRPVQDVAA